MFGDLTGGHLYVLAIAIVVGLVWGVAWTLIPLVFGMMLYLGG